MIDKLLAPYTFKHRDEEAFHSTGIPLPIIDGTMSHTIEVHHQSYARFIPDGTVDLYTKRNARVA